MNISKVAIALEVIKNLNILIDNGILTKEQANEIIFSGDPKILKDILKNIDKKEAILTKEDFKI